MSLRPGRHPFSSLNNAHPGQNAYIALISQDEIIRCGPGVYSQFSPKCSQQTLHGVHFVNSGPLFTKWRYGKDVLLQDLVKTRSREIPG